MKNLLKDNYIKNISIFMVRVKSENKQLPLISKYNQVKDLLILQVLTAEPLFYSASFEQ